MTELNDAISKTLGTHSQEGEISEGVTVCNGEQVAVNAVISDLLQRMCEEKYEHRVRLLQMIRAACDEVEQTMS